MAPLLEIYSDYDGTITKVDSVDYILGKLADPAWLDIETKWERGEIGSRECMAEQVALIRGGWSAIEQLLPEIEVDSTFASFIKWCKQGGTPFKILSDGLDRSIHHVLRREGVKVDTVIANRLVELSDQKLMLEFPYKCKFDGCTSGVCKCEIIKAPSDSRIKVFIGDGRSDFCCARTPDYLFAKSKLLKFCRENDIPCIPFETFADISRYLEKEVLPRFVAPSHEHKMRMPAVRMCQSVCA